MTPYGASSTECTNADQFIRDHSLDILFAADVPQGHGNSYAVDDFENTLIEISDPEGWTASDLVRLIGMLGV